MHACKKDGSGRKYEDTNIKGADTELDIWYLFCVQMHVFYLRD